MRLKPEFARFSAFLLDCDGVLWRGGEPIPGAREAVKALRASGRKVLFFTNNATLSRKGYLEKLRGLGFEAEVGEIYCSAYAAAAWLKGRVKKVYVVGEEGLVEELELAGLEAAGPDEAECVVVGLDRKLTYRKLEEALRCLIRGALFVATNRDPTLPTERGLAPGAGAIVSALEAAAGREADMLIGKPSTYMYELALREHRIEPATALAVGDRLDTDIEGAKRAGLAAALVLTGATGLRELERARVKPDYVLASIRDLFE
jgi:phosphoglycolate/pyridoxal phosphate phosphatase family enzyme